MFSAESELPITDITDPNFNVSQKMTEFIDAMVNYSTFFQTRNILLPWGGDFYFRNFNYSKFYFDC